MPSKLLCKLTKSYRQLSLQNIITLPFLLQIFVTVSLVGYFSWRNGEQAVNNVSSQLRSEVTAGVEDHLQNYLTMPQLIVRLKQNSIRTGQLNIDDFLTIQQDFWSTIQLFDTVRAIYIGDETGKFRYSKREKGIFYSKEVVDTPVRKTYILDDLGQKQELIAVDEYNPQERLWYINTSAIQKNNWSKIYTFTGGELGITAAGLLRDNQGNTQGIVGVDLVLSGIDRFLQNIEVSQHGRVFILERNGYLVATSTDEKPFTYDSDSKKEKRLRAIDSQSLLVKETTKHITKHFQSLYNVKHSQHLEFQLDNNKQLVQVVPYQDQLGLDWLIVVVLPEADFMSEIHANNLNIVWLCLIAIAIATIVGIYTSGKIAQPIANLSQITSMIAKSARAKNTGTNLYPIIKVKSIKELQCLAKSFNEMVIQLKAAFKDLENSNASLESRVRQRTEALMAAKEAADRANHAKSEFLANMSHELRTPLHAILGFTQVALQDGDLKSQPRENLLIVKRSGEHLLTLINDILEMSKIEAGSLSINPQPFDLYLLLENLAKMFQLRSHQKNIKLTFDLPTNLPRHIETDPVKLNQILINLIENGIKFTDRGGVTLNLKLVTELNQISLAFAVVDTGHGILSSELESIFVPFIQTKRSDRAGTGLGLAICQQFVRLLGGEITVSSSLGQGSLFRFQIPITIVKQQDTSTVQQHIQNFDRVRSDSLFSPALQRQTKDLPPCTSDFSPPKHRQLFTSDFANISTEWIEKLRQAAIAVDSDSISQLIKQLPFERADFARGLTRMLKDFEYDEIVELVETELQKRRR